MNAIAMDKHGNIIDPYEGRKDIADKVIRTVGSAKERFQEDALRMMRAVRFVSQLSFEVEPQSLSSVKNVSAICSKRFPSNVFPWSSTGFLPDRNHQSGIRILADTGLYFYLPGFRNKKDGLIRFNKLKLDEELTLEERWHFAAISFIAKRR